MSENPYQAPSAIVRDPTSGSAEPSTSAYGKAWGLFFLITTFGGGLLGMILGGIGGYFLARAGVGLTAIQITGGILGIAVGMPISFFTFRWSVRRYIVRPLLSG